jgi:L-cysteine desulfidase
MKVSENTNVAMPIKNMVGIIVAVAMGIFAYTEITARLTSLETSRELMTADLLKKSEQTTVDKEQYLLLEDLYETVEKHQELLDKNIHNQVMLQHIEKMLDKALEDIENLKDANREMKYTNGTSH